MDIERTRPATSFIDREEERAAIWAALTKPGERFLTLTGPGGIGKSRLARDVACQLKPEFHDGVLHVPLAEIKDPALVVGTVIKALGLPDLEVAPDLERLQSRLEAANLLLFIDGIERAAAVGPLLVQLLRTCSGLKILATSRAPMRVAFERVFPVHPLPVPDTARRPKIEELARNPSVKLLVQRARSASPDFVLTNENASEIVDICTRVDGLPLAIELAAARLQVLSPAALGKRLGRPLDLLARQDPKLPEHQRTLRGVIGCSEELLSPPAQLLFPCASVFIEGFAAKAAEAVCAPLPVEEDPSCAVLDGLAELIDVGLLQRGVADGEPRFTMQNTICEYARERLEQRGDEEAVRRRHALYFLSVAEENVSELRGPDRKMRLRRLDLELANFRGAMDWSLEHDPSTGLRWAAVLWRFWEATGDLGEGRRWLEAALAAAGEKTVERVQVLYGLGVLQWAAGALDAALATLEECLALAEELDDRSGMASARTDRALVEFVRSGNSTLAREAIEGVLRDFRDVEDSHAETRALLALGTMHLDQKDLPEATMRFGEALALALRLVDALSQSLILKNLGHVARLEGRVAEATAHFNEAIQLACHLGIRQEVLSCLAGLGGVAVERKEFDLAARLLGASAELALALGIEFPPCERAQADRDIATAEAALSAARFRNELAVGRSLSVDQAVENARVGDGESARASSNPGLTARELEVLELLVGGKSQRQIAESLFISTGTVKTHVKHINSKLGVRSRAALAAQAIARGLV